MFFAGEGQPQEWKTEAPRHRGFGHILKLPKLLHFEQELNENDIEDIGHKTRNIIWIYCKCAM